MKKLVYAFLAAHLAACVIQPDEVGSAASGQPDTSVACDASGAPDGQVVDAGSVPDAPNVPDAPVPDAAAVDAPPMPVDAPTAPDAGPSCDAPVADAAMLDAAPVPDAAPPPDAPPPDTHLIYCSALDASGGRTYEFRGNLRTGLVGNAPAWLPSYLGYGSDYNGHGWPNGTPNSASNIGAITFSNGWATWTVAPWTFTSFNAVQGFTPYVASGSSMQWIDMAKWSIASGQYCTKSAPVGTKLCSCNSLPCTPANALNAPNCTDPS